MPNSNRKCQPGHRWPGSSLKLFKDQHRQVCKASCWFLFSKIILSIYSVTVPGLKVSTHIISLNNQNNLIHSSYYPYLAGKESKVWKIMLLIENDLFGLKLGLIPDVSRGRVRVPFIRPSFAPLYVQSCQDRVWWMWQKAAMPTWHVGGRACRLCL